MEPPALGRKTAHLDSLRINTIRTLSAYAVQAANSGHPGPLKACAPVASLLRNDIMSKR